MAFSQGQIPKLAYLNFAKTPLGFELGDLVRASQRFVDELFAPAWGTPARLQPYSLAKGVPDTAWGMVFLDDADQANAMGYHDLTNAGLPLSKVFVKPGNAALTACHELCEMLVDPACNLWAEDAKGALWALEVCDACEEEEFEIDGIPMSDFVYPAYFESFRTPGSARFDYLGKIDRPFKLLKGGYGIVRAGSETKEVFGSAAKARRFAREDRRGHRSELRQ